MIVAVAAAHRGEAFAGAREAIDRIKAEAPIWKREIEGGESRWVEGKSPSSGLTHIGPDGAARMVDVGGKAESERRAVRRGARPDGRRRPRGPSRPATGRRATCSAPPGSPASAPPSRPGRWSRSRTRSRSASSTSAPRSTPRPGSSILTAEARCVGRTGVEIEAMAAASIAALTVYDMVKALERGVEIERVRLLHKSGGKSGEWNADG